MKVLWTPWRKIKSCGQVSGCISKLSMPESETLSWFTRDDPNSFNVKKTNVIGGKSTHQSIVRWDDWQLFLSFMLKFDFPNMSSLRPKLTDGCIGTDLIFWGFIPLPHHGPVEVHSAVTSALSKWFNYVTKSRWHLLKAVSRAPAVSKQKQSRSYKSAFSWELTLWEVLPAPLQLFPYSICKTKDGCLSTHPRRGSGYALSIYCSASWSWPQFPGRVLECERWGGLWRFPSRSALQLRIQETELFKTNTCINHA